MHRPFLAQETRVSQGRGWHDALTMQDVHAGTAEACAQDALCRLGVHPQLCGLCAAQLGGSAGRCPFDVGDKAVRALPPPMLVRFYKSPTCSMCWTGIWGATYLHNSPEQHCQLACFLWWKSDDAKSSHAFSPPSCRPRAS